MLTPDEPYLNYKGVILLQIKLPLSQKKVNNKIINKFKVKFRVNLTLNNEEKF